MTVKRAIALVLVLAALVVGVRYMLRLEGADQSRLNNLYAEAEPLQKQRDELLQERDNLELDYALMMRDVSTVQLLFRELDTKLFTDVYPLMRDRGITGVLGISGSQYPNYWGKITVEHYNRLMMDGWGSCLVYDSGDTLENWLAYMKSTLEFSNIELPAAIYFVGSRYDVSYDDILKSYGITTVVCDAADGHTNTVTDVTGELWFTGAMPWNYTGVNSDLELLARTDGGNLCFTISFDNLWDSYEEKNFIQMMDVWKGYLEEQELVGDQIRATPSPTATNMTAEEQLEIPLLRPQNFVNARADHLTATQNNAALEKEFLERRAELEEQIANLDVQIREVYARWEQREKLPGRTEEKQNG